MSELEFNMIDYIAGEIATERWHQDEKFGDQSHLPDGTGLDAIDCQLRIIFQNRCDTATEAGTLTWADILREEVYEAFAESDPEKLDAELLQVASVCVAWIQALRTRSGKTLKRDVLTKIEIPYIGRGGESL